MITIRHFPDVPASRAEIEQIFFGASATQWFESEEARAAFLERWLGRYLLLYPEDALVAVDDDGSTAGYLVGCLDDATELPLFQDIPYFASFRSLAKRYPAHLHINVAPQYRNQGVGARLIEAFAEHAKARCAAGMHAVTAVGSRNNPFYLRCGFEQAGFADMGGVRLVFFARDLSPPASP